MERNGEISFILIRHFDWSVMKWNGMEKSHTIGGDFSTPLRFARSDEKMLWFQKYLVFL